MTLPFSQTRRHLLLLSASIASAVGTAMTAFGQKPKTPTKPKTDEFTAVVGPASILEKYGKVLTDKVLIVRNSTNQKLVAVSPLCPHRNCVVDWQQSTQRFICPCHDSEFGVDGKVLKGPSEKGLTAFDVKIEENRFWIKPQSGNKAGNT